MSQVHYQGITLAELVKRSDLVLVVKPAKPPQRQLQIPIGKDQKHQEAPAFMRVQRRCEVQVALSAAGSELVGKTIEIDGAHWQQSLSMHKSYYLQGISKSPIYERYHPAEPAVKGPGTTEGEAGEGAQKDTPFIVFLRRDGQSGFAFVVDGAQESLKNRAAIEELLRQPK